MDPVEIQGVAARRLGEHLQVDRRASGEIDATGQAVRVQRDHHVATLPSVEGLYRIEDHGAHTRETLRAGRACVVEDADLNPRSAAHAVQGDDAAMQVQAAVVIPLVKAERLVALLARQQGKPRVWTPSELHLKDDVAERAWAAVERSRAETTLRAGEECHRAIIETATDDAIFTTDIDGRIETWPPDAQQVFGWSADEAVCQPMEVTYTPADLEAGVPAIEQQAAQETGQAPNVRWHICKDGSPVFIDGVMQLPRGSDGELLGFLKVDQDVTRQRGTQERLKVLMAELRHRTRNLLAVVQALASAASLEDFGSTHHDRMRALACVNSVLSRLREDNRIAFDEVIHAELAAHGAVDHDGWGAQVTLTGPQSVRLRSSTVQTLALAPHELATGAVEYGALAHPEGRLPVRWRRMQLPQGPGLQVERVQSGVAMPDPSPAPWGGGYGRERTQRALPYQIGAETTDELGPDGLPCTITLPLSSMELDHV